MANTKGGDKTKPKKKATTKKPAAKKPTTRKRTPKKANPNSKYYDPSVIWTPISGRSFGAAYPNGSDIYGSQPIPSPADLLNAYEDVVYSCVNLISHAVSREAGKFRLVATTGPNDPRPKSPTRPFTLAEVKRIEAAHPKYTRRAVAVEQVVDHGLLDLLDQPNKLHSFEKLLEMTQVFVELCGSAFWYVAGPVVAGRKVPTELWLLPSHLITIETDEQTGAITGYEFQDGDQAEVYAPDDVIHIKYTIDPLDPYTSFGRSPVRAVWQRVQLLRQEQSSWQAVLSNMAVPSALVYPPDGETFTPVQAERIAKQVSERFRLGNQGGVWVVQDAMKYQPVSTPPKDLAALQMYDQIKAAVARAYNIPLAVLDLSDGTSEANDVAKRNFSQYCLAPRVESILGTISHRLAPPRTFLTCDSVIVPDKVYELQRTTALVAGNVMTVNEGRVAAGLDPKPGYDKLVNELFSVGTASAQTFAQNSVTPVTKSRTKAYRSTTPDPKPLAEALKGVFTKLGQVVAGKLVGKAADVRTKSWFPIDTWTDGLKAALTPVLKVYFEEGTDAVLAEVGGGPDIRRHAVQELDRAVDRAVLALADSTLSTTALSVEDAVAATREAIRAGLDQGEANLQLADRIKDIFTDLSDRRAMLVAETESTRAKHGGELIAIRAAEVSARKVWLPDGMACDVCRTLAAKGPVPLDKEFATLGHGPYSRIDHPPAHPACRCTLQYEFDD